MKITNNTIDKNIDQVKPGELFVITDNEDFYGSFPGLFMKIVNKNGNDNAVKIDNGELYTINRNTIVQIINGELIV